MTTALTIDAAAQGLADEQAWLADSPERCATCGHRECFHAHDGDDGLFCLVDGCRCRDGALDDPSEAPVPGVYGETVFGSGHTKALTISSLGEPPLSAPGMFLEFNFAEKGHTTMTERDIRLADILLHADAASEGPWTVREDEWPEEPAEHVLVVREDAPHPNPDIEGCTLVLAGGVRRADAAFIAASRADVPWLVREVTMLEAERDELRARLQQAAADRAERGAWSRAWELLTDSHEGQTHAVDAIVGAARRMRERAEKAEAGLRRLHACPQRALHPLRMVDGELSCPWCEIERLSSENESLQKDLAQAQEDHRITARACQEHLDEIERLRALVDAASTFWFGVDGVPGRALTRVESNYPGEWYVVKNDGTQKRFDKRDEAIANARSYVAARRRMDEQLVCPLDGIDVTTIDAGESCVPPLPRKT